MVGARDVRVNFGVSDFIGDCFTCKPVVYAPTDIASPGVCPVSPPGIGRFLLGIFVAEGVDESGRLKCVKSGSFFVCEAVLADVWLWIREVNFVMRNVKISAKENGLYLLKFFDMLKECGVPLLVA